MNIQLKKGFVEACVLSSLRSEPSYGYKIINDISIIIEISESTLYPILRRLETAGLLRTFSQDHNGRLRKYYSITKAGIERIEEFKQDWKEMQAVYNFIISKERTR